MWVLIVSWFVTGQPVTSFQVQFATKELCRSAAGSYVHELTETRSMRPDLNLMNVIPMTVCVDTGRTNN
jgi:hypothetical protein